MTTLTLQKVIAGKQFRPTPVPAGGSVFKGNNFYGRRLPVATLEGADRQPVGADNEVMRGCGRLGEWGWVVGHGVFRRRRGRVRAAAAVRAARRMRDQGVVSGGAVAP
jgi:pyridoxal biosynthesis lyase PdxS